MFCFLFICVPLAFLAAWGLRSVYGAASDATRCACGYSREGLPVEAACPECGLPPGTPRPPRALATLAPLIAILACPVLVFSLSIGAFPDWESAGMALFTWCIAAFGIVCPMELAMRRLPNGAAVVLGWCAAAAFLGSLAWALVYAYLAATGRTKPGEYGPGFDIAISLALGGPLVALNAGSWVFAAVALVMLVMKRRERPE